MTDRHRFRAAWHDYDSAVYFVTVCAANKRSIFGHIAGDTMLLNELGLITDKAINEIPQHYPYVEIWNHVVMPNHVHMVVFVGTRHAASASTARANCGCLHPSRHGEPCADNHHNSQLARIVGSFKSAVTRIARTRHAASLQVWQPRYHDHIIRHQMSFDNIMNYIDNNPAIWSADCFNPSSVKNTDL